MASSRPNRDSVDYVTSCKLPTPWATFQLHAFLDHDSAEEVLALTLGAIDDTSPVLVRVHSECLTGDGLFSQRCDCGAQLEAALKQIAAEGRGMVVYLRQEGRGIGLLNKLRAYRLQDEGADTVEANERLGFAADLRNYDVCKPVFEHFGVKRVRLLTNNPRKVKALGDQGITVEERIPLQVNRNPFNEHYLSTKAAKLGHWLGEVTVEGGTGSTVDMATGESDG